MKNEAPEHYVWRSIKSRCYREKDICYKQYGGRGISVCDRWLQSFDNFLSDMGQRPSNKHSIERINNDGNYEPDNCKWALPEEQYRNRRSNVWIEYNGLRMIKADWERYFGIKRPNRMRRDLKTFEEVYNHYMNKKRRPEVLVYNNNAKTIFQWSLFLKISDVTLRRHLKKQPFEQVYKYFSIKNNVNENSKV